MIFRADKNITKIKFIKNNETKEFNYWCKVHEISDKNSMYLIFEHLIEDGTIENLEDNQTIFIEKEQYVGADGDIKDVRYKYYNMSLNVKYKLNSPNEITKMYYVFSNNSSLDDNYRVLKAIL